MNHHFASPSAAFRVSAGKKQDTVVNVECLRNDAGGLYVADVISGPKGRNRAYARPNRR